jgi:hypothetical protein
MYANEIENKDAAKRRSVSAPQSDGDDRLEQQLMKLSALIYWSAFECDKRVRLGG